MGTLKGFSQPFHDLASTHAVTTTTNNLQLSFLSVCSLCLPYLLLDIQQVDQAERGFSFSKAAPLDMRMGPDAPVSAKDMVNTWSESELGQVFREYGEERHWKGIASRYTCHRIHTCSAAYTQLAGM